MYNDVASRGGSASNKALALIAAQVWSDGMVASQIGRRESAASPTDLELLESPVGDLPFEGPSHVMATTEYGCATDSCGTWSSITADCGCSDTYTGGCSCFSIWGTSCWTCS